jgi:hypothetical protein
MRSVPPVVFVSLLGLAACAPAGSSAYVSANVPLNGDCTASEGEISLSTGLYDVLSNRTEKTDCIKPYRMSLVINSNLVSNPNVAVGRVEPNALRVQYADVTLLDNSEAIVNFEERDNVVPPNPYRVYTTASIAPSTGDDPSTGWVQLDAIPAAYGEQLRGYAGTNILVEIQLSGTTTSDVDVDFQPFLYPLAICSDCLSRCRSDPQFVTDPSRLTDLNSGKCSDNRAQDDRTCVDQGC